MKTEQSSKMKTERTPTIVAPHGRAWRLDLDTMRKMLLEQSGHLGQGQKTDACLDRWIVFAPWAHPAWSFYEVVLVHLRPMEDNRPTMFYRSEATHEVWVAALDPDGDLEKVFTHGALLHLSPLNFAAQIIADSDESAQERIRKTVEDIINARLNPDTDALSVWRTRFGDSMVKI